MYKGHGQYQNIKIVIGKFFAREQQYVIKVIIRRNWKQIREIMLTFC